MWLTRLRERIPQLPEPLQTIYQRIKPHLPPLNFITIHYAYFITTCLLTSLIFWGASTPGRTVSYIDCLFFTVSAMTEAGLNTVNLSELNTFQQILLFLLIMVGSNIFVSSFVVHVRRTTFERRFTNIIEEERRKRKERKHQASISHEKTHQRPGSHRRSHSVSQPEVDGVVIRGRIIASRKDSDVQSRSDNNPGNHPPRDREAGKTSVVADGPTESEPQDRFQQDDIGGKSQRASEDGSTGVASSGPQQIRFATSPVRSLSKKRASILSMQGVGARHDLSNHPSQAPRTPLYPIPLAALTEEKGEQILHGTQKYFKSGGFIGRNSQFHNLTLEERERLGGVEYRAIMLLEYIVPLYFFLFQLLGCIGLGAYVAINRPDEARQNGLNPFWVGAFNAVSAFNNSGMSLVDANMVAFQTSIYMLVTMGFLILAGNTCYPVFLRLILWTMYKLLPDQPGWQERRQTLRFLLDHPRRCYTTLFPSGHTWWLLLTLVILNGTDWLAFEILNLGNPLTKTLPVNIRVIDGLFQALAVRSGGFYVVSISGLRIGLLFLYVIMMYISAYPVLITMRNSNVYEERSLGIYADDPPSYSAEHTNDRSDDPLTTATSPKEGTFRRRIRTSFSRSRTATILTSHTDPTASSNRPGKESRSYFVRQQLHGQLAHDVWWIVLAVLFIVITETSQFERDPVDYSVFNVVFEVVSGYGCVGISVGLPNVAYSFCGGWHKFNSFPSSAAFDAINDSLKSNDADRKDAVQKGKAIFAFVLKNKSGETSTWYIDLKDKGEVGQGDVPNGGKADVTLSLSDEDFGKMAAGTTQAQRLFMSGKLKIKGDVMKATKMEPILKKAQTKAKL
ncbi:hypothetical protein MMC25_003281 [Agyrium rufum]|nr:hypothetical protein [Agyrium rufum]